jgi:anti-sigma factor RsiW
MGNELTEQQQEDWLDARLRDEMPNIDDAGFTARVVQQLPQRKRASRAVRAAVLLVAAFLASALAFIFAGRSVANAVAFLFALPPTTLWVLAGSVLLLLLLVSGSFALTKARDSR